MAVEHLHPPARVSFIVFAPLTGQILRTGTCAQTDLHLQAGLGEAVTEGSANDETQYFLNGDLVNYPPCPGDWAVYDYVAHEWVDPRTPEMLAEAAQKQARAQALAYLADTDWVAVRAAETGTPIPESVSEQRAAARALLSS